VPPLVRKISARSSDVQAAMNAAVRDIMATIDIPAIARNHADQARQAVTAARATLSALTTRRRQSQARAGLLTDLLQARTHDKALTDTGNATRAVRRAVVAELRSIIDTTAEPDLRRAAAITLHNLSGRGVREVTRTDLAKAVRICGCRG
jgi:activator of 2-hydroxyglutaryl-CoA dehydratase